MLNFGDDRFFVKYPPRGDLSISPLHYYFFRRSVGTRRYISHFTPSDCVLYVSYATSLQFLLLVLSWWSSWVKAVLRPP